MENTCSTGNVSISNETICKVFNETLCSQCYTAATYYLTIIGVMAVIGNSLMVVMLLSTQFRQPVNFLILNCLFCNLIESAVGFPMAVASNFAKRWLFGHHGCVLYGFIMYTVILNNMVSLATIGVYRYVSVFHKQGKRLTEKTMVLKIIVFTWLYALGWSILPLLGWGSYGFDRLGTSCAVKWEAETLSEKLYILSMFLFVFLIPMLITSIAYVKIFKRIVLQLHSPISPIDSPTMSSENGRRPTADMGGRRRKLEIEIMLTKIIAVNALLFCMAWMPYGVLSFVSTLGVRLSVEMTVLPLLIAKSQCAFTPLVYSCAHKEYRSAVLKMSSLCYSKLCDKHRSKINLQSNDILYIIDDRRVAGESIVLPPCSAIDKAC